MANILIIGCGFGGLVSAEELSAPLPAGQHNHHSHLAPSRLRFLSSPSPGAAFGKLEISDISFGLAENLTSLCVHFVRGDVVMINPETREVQIYGDDFNGNLHSETVATFSLTSGNFNALRASRN